MNPKQMIVLWIGILAAAIVLCLPLRVWQESAYATGTRQKSVVLALALVTLGGIYSLKDRQ